MKTIETTLSETVLRQAEELAARENITLEELIGLAATQTIGVWSNELHLALQNKEDGREKFLEALTQTLDFDGFARPAAIELESGRVV